MLYEIEVPKYGLQKINLWIPGEMKVADLMSPPPLPEKTIRRLATGVALLLEENPERQGWFIPVSVWGGTPWESPELTVYLVGIAPFTKQHAKAEERLNMFGKGYHFNESLGMFSGSAFTITNEDPIEATANSPEGSVYEIPVGSFRTREICLWLGTEKYDPESALEFAGKKLPRKSKSRLQLGLMMFLDQHPEFEEIVNVTAWGGIPWVNPERIVYLFNTTPQADEYVKASENLSLFPPEHLFNESIGLFFQGGLTIINVDQFEKDTPISWPMKWLIYIVATIIFLVRWVRGWFSQKSATRISDDMLNSILADIPTELQYGEEGQARPGFDDLDFELKLDLEKLSEQEIETLKCFLNFLFESMGE